MDDMPGVARVMWTLFEPVHAVLYFAPEARSAFEEAGLRGFWRGYFAGRAAPLGVTGPGVVTASFYNFAPSMVARAIPGIWELITPDEALRVRRTGAVRALRELLGDLEPDGARVADLLWRAVGELDFAGRVLGAANGELAPPDDGLARLWLAATILREHRGDGHFAALLAAGIDGCEAVVLRSGLDMRRDVIQPVRRWTDEQWEDARARLAARGLVGQDGAITSEGRAVHDAVEQATDRAATQPWQRIGPGATAGIRAALTPLAQACAKIIPYPSPIGLPATGPS